MKNNSVVLLSMIVFWGGSIESNAVTLYKGERPSSEPYVSGDTFRKYCDHVIDIKNPHFDPAVVKKGDIVFLSGIDFGAEPSACIEKFFRYYANHISVPYILVTHNSDLNITEKFKSYLETENLFAWFAQNVAFSHPKLKCLPIGLENELWGRHYVDMLNCIRSSGHKAEKKYLLYMNFTAATNSSVRRPVYNHFVNKDFCHVTGRMDTESYLKDVIHAKFVLSPHGNGLDCHRTWEALYLGVIPVVKKSSLDPLYEGLPVVIVNDWSEITREFLEQKYKEMSGSTYRLEKLYMPYWQDLFRMYKLLCGQ